MDSYYSEEELEKIGLSQFGKNVKLSRKCSMYAPKKIKLGNNVRIDDFCFISGNISIGDHVHIAPFTLLYGGDEGIKIEDFAGVSSKVAIYAESDDYVGSCMHNPNIPEKYKNIIRGNVILRKHSLIGTGCTLLPGTDVGEGTSIGAMSLVSGKLRDWRFYFGIPARELYIRDSNKVLDFEKEYIEKI